MKKLVLLALLWLGIFSTHAQTKSGHYLAAETMLQTMNMQQTLDESINQVLAIQIKNNPGLQPAEATLKQFFRKYMSWESLKDDYIKIYMGEFTEMELKEMTAFFKTEVGKKMAAKQTVLMMKGSQLGQAKVQEHMGELQEMLQKIDH